jgi:hypothetical protein
LSGSGLLEPGTTTVSGWYIFWSPELAFPSISVIVHRTMKDANVADLAIPSFAGIITPVAEG